MQFLQLAVNVALWVCVVSALLVWIMTAMRFVGYLRFRWSSRKNQKSPEQREALAHEIMKVVVWGLAFFGVCLVMALLSLTSN